MKKFQSDLLLSLPTIKPKKLKGKSVVRAANKVVINELQQNNTYHLYYNNKNDYNTLINDTITTITANQNIGISVDDIERLNLDRLSNSVIIPSKMEATIRNHVSLNLKTNIDQDIEVAEDLAMIMASMITQYGFIDNETSGDTIWTYIASSRFIDLFGMRRYPKILKLLMRATKTKEPFIECDETAVIGGKVFGYRFSETYRNKGMVKYKIKTEEGRSILRSLQIKKIIKAIQNPIAKKMLKSYCKITLPTIDEIMAEAQRLEGKQLKNGKILKFLNTRSRTEYVKGKYKFVEDAVKLFKFLTEDGLLIPVVSGERAGGRVCDSFTLIPSWIRGLCTINGVKLSDCEMDYKALHPNLVYFIYGNEEETKQFWGDAHTKIADISGVSRMDIKIEHLSFFNKQIWQMKKSPLYEIYNTYCQNMIANLELDKKKHGHKNTSKELFNLEVSIMTEVINQIEDSADIVYVYDALYSDNIDLVSQIMNEVVMNFGINTYAN